MPEMRNFMTSQDWGPLKMEIGNFKLIKIAFKCQK